MNTVHNYAQLALEQLSPPFTYFPIATADNSTPVFSHTEPTALAAIALYGHDRIDDAVSAADLLAECQHADGVVAPTTERSVKQWDTPPRWPTSLALLAWRVVTESRPNRYEDQIQRAVSVLLDMKGEKINPTPELGHDTQLVGWPWVDGTHSWVEPTCLAVIALKAAGYSDHPRVREGVRLLRDRQIRGGAWNHGNTVVLGQTQANQVQPTGMALTALAGEDDPRHRNDSAIRYLLRELQRGTGTVSTCWAWHGLAAHGALPANLEFEIAMTTRHVLDQKGSRHKLALLSLAALGEHSPLITIANAAALGAEV